MGGRDNPFPFAESICQCPPGGGGIFYFIRTVLRYLPVRNDMNAGHKNKDNESISI